jgi:CheY-like chemotaxis protein
VSSNGGPAPEMASGGRVAWIVEDEPAAAALASDLCDASGITAVIFSLPLPFLTALRTSTPPSMVVLDWRLERELSAALFLATRHRHPRMPVIYWTASHPSALPSMISDDPLTMIVDKAAGTGRFDEALRWASTSFGDRTGEGSAVS